MRNQQEYLRIINLVSKFAIREDKDKKVSPIEPSSISDATTP